MEGRRQFGPLMSRRTFVKASAALGAAVVAADALGGGIPVLSTLEEAAAAGSTASLPDAVIDCVCRPDCGGICRHSVTRRDGNVVNIGMGKLPDPEYNRISQRGLAMIPQIYDPNRIKYPMKRVGARGEDKWEAISWDQAITEITDKMKDISTTHGPAANCFMIGTGNYAALNGTMPGANTRFQNAIGASSVEMCVDIAIVHGLGRVMSWGSDWFTRNESKDIANAKTIILWGNNLTEADLHNWHFVADAMDKGAKVIVIGPVFTQVASKAHQFVPVRPGTDPALMLSMLNVIIEEKRYNAWYARRHTVAPYLVRTDTKKFLRMSDLGVKPKIVDGVPVDPVAVWDPKRRRAVPDGSIARPSLRGFHRVKGIRVRTALDMLAREAAKYPPEVASKITEVPAGTIRRLARRAAGKKVTHLAGYGPQAYSNGVMVGHALATLAVLTGNVGRPGASAGVYWNYYDGINWGFSSPDDSWGAGPAIPALALRDVLTSGEFKGEPFPIKSLHVQAANPLSNQVDRKSWTDEILPALDLVVVRDIVFSDTARYADYVLPVAHWYETEDLILFGASHPFLQYSPKVIEPQWESKPDVEIYRLMANAMGGKAAADFAFTDAELLEQTLVVNDTYTITADMIKQKPQHMYGGKTFIAYENAGFMTPSGKAEFYVENPAPRMDYGQAYNADRERLPRWFPPQEAWKANPLFKKYPLVLVSERNKYRVHSIFFGNPWLGELVKEAFVRINPKDAAPRWISDGDYVEVFNDRGTAVARAKVTESVKPGVLSYPKGWQKHEMKAGHFQELTGTLVDQSGVNQSFFDTLVEVRIWNGVI
jgi:molybdopterin-containing oxidoreductase family molybdopterin binding subunit